jgi:hypothetical protein
VLSSASLLRLHAAVLEEPIQIYQAHSQPQPHTHTRQPVPHAALQDTGRMHSK